MPPENYRSKKKITALSLAFVLCIFGAVQILPEKESVSFAAETGENGKAGEQAPPPVEVITVQAKQLRVWNEFSGNLEAVDTVAIKPRVSGAIIKSFYKQGGSVKAGATLFIIDPRPYEATLQQSQARAEAARAAVKLSKSDLTRAEQLTKKKALSQSRYETAKNAYETAIADVKAADATVRQARLNLEYAYVKAPVSGKVGRAEITEGNLVEAGAGAPVLTTIVSDREIYAEFDVDEKTYIQNVRGQMRESPVEVTIASEDHVAYTGKIVSFDNRLNVKTGTIRARALLQNKDGALTPGMFAKVRLGSPELKTLVTVPEKALGTDQDKKYVLVANDKNIVEYRIVTLGEGGEAGERVIREGLKPGEKVLVNSLQKVRPGMPITPKDVTEKK